METNFIALGGRILVNPDELIMLQADINYTIIYFKNGRKEIVATPLKTLEMRFRACSFYRTHKSFLVNLSCIKIYFSSKNTLQMIDNHVVDVSRRKTEGLKKHLSYSNYR